jgi:predicted DNA-binding transcriptional regulator YafY
VNAREVAEELEVSERTARRDLEALGLAGLPVYSRQGRNGGWSLAGGGRTDLSGLNAAEVRALFLLAGPLSVTPDVRAALRKLVRAVPESFRATAESAAKAVVIDPSSWEGSPNTRKDPPFLDDVQRSVVDAEQIEIGYVSRETVSTTRTIHPLGLAVKGASWYLLADTEAGRRTFRVDRITSLRFIGEPVVRPDGFDLEATWREIVGEVQERRTPVRARALVDPDFVHLVRWVLGHRLRIGPSSAEGRVEVELRGSSIGSLAGQIAGFGSAVEVIGHPGLSDELARIGRELVGAYGPRPGD